MKNSGGLHSISVRFDAQTWARIESMRERVRANTGMLPSANEALTALVRDGLDLRGDVGTSAVLPGWEHEQNANIWRREIRHNGLRAWLQVDTNATVDQYHWLAYYADMIDSGDDDDYIMPVSKGYAQSPLAAMIQCETIYAHSFRGDK